MGLKDIFKSKQPEELLIDRRYGAFQKDEGVLNEGEGERAIKPPAPSLQHEQPVEREKPPEPKQEAKQEPTRASFLSKKEEPEKIEGLVQGPVGLDIGTSNIVVAQKKGNNIRTFVQLNAFFTIPHSSITRKALSKDETIFFERNESLYIMGDSAEDFANMFRGNTRRPIESGILNPKEEESEIVIKAIVNKLLKGPQRRIEKVCFSVPGEPADMLGSTVYHESIIKRHLKALGYDPVPINEGLAVVLSELSGNNFTGIGISIGGGMCNVCFSYLTVPVITYSIQKGGDYIDAMVGSSVGEPSTKIKVLKEEGLDLSVDPRNRIETGLHIYYEDLFTTLAQSMQQALGSSDNIPRLSKAIPIVLSGGSVAPRGSREKFQQALKGLRFPIKISEIVVAEKPLHATAKGALMMALTD